MPKWTHGGDLLDSLPLLSHRDRRTPPCKQGRGRPASCHIILNCCKWFWRPVKKFQDYLKVWKSSASILVWLLVPFHVGDSSSSRIKIMIKDYTLDTKDPHLRVVFEQLWECLSEWGDAGVGSSLKISSQKAFFKVLAFCLTFLFAPAKLRMILSWKEAPPSTLHHYSSSTSLLNWSSTKSLKISSSPFPQASQQALPPRLSPSLKRTFCILYKPIVTISQVPQLPWMSEASGLGNLSMQAFILSLETLFMFDS